MLDYSFNHPINVHFGKSALSKMPDEIKKKTNKVMLVYGGGSVKANGTYDAIIKTLKDAGISYVDFGGITKPYLGNVKEGIKLARAEKVGCIIGIGGSTCMDMAKVIAFGAENEDEYLWDYISGKMSTAGKPRLLIGAVPTYPSGGSETGKGAIVDDEVTGANGTLYGFIPDFSILNPEFSYTLGKLSTAYGAMVTFIQISLNYFTGNSPISERLIEGLCDTIRESLEIALEDPTNYNARANQTHASIFGTNAVPSLGKDRTWTYNIYDYVGVIRRKLGIAYRETFTVIFPYWLRAETKYHADEIKKYMVNIWGANERLSASAACEEGVQNIIAYYKKVGLPTKYNDIKTEMPSKEELIAAIEAEYADNMMPPDEVVVLFQDCMNL
ncbi:MAG: iron-containing alcohol dehydrogenase [Firmicutes bacterium]|nr:iron-containing alcohol dehydrogenase [Bacillota bacterium]